MEGLFRESSGASDSGRPAAARPARPRCRRAHPAARHEAHRGWPRSPPPTGSMPGTRRRKHKWRDCIAGISPETSPTRTSPASRITRRCGSGVGGWPSRKAGFQPAGKPHAPSAFPPPPFSSPTHEKTGDTVAPIQAAAPAGEDATAEAGRTKAGRTGGKVCDDVKQRSDSLAVSQTPDLRPNR
jgi:hypothetical protein